MAENSKPSIPKGTRDFTPKEMIRRDYIFGIIKRNFELFGYQPVETPAIENLSTLLGKYGEEGDKLLFRILNSGDFSSSIQQEELKNLTPAALSLKICDRGLRYDLTVPFARFVVQHRNEITFPFRRYQIQPVWRADRPQKGRYREFYQCDADVIGSNSLLNEVDLLQLIDKVFNELGIRVVIKINNRKILAGIAEKAGEPEKLTVITQAIDKLEKAGKDKVIDELRDKGLSEKAIDVILPLFDLKGELTEKIRFLRSYLEQSAFGQKGLDEVEEMIRIMQNIQMKNCLELDITLARGLNYYTGAIIEVKALDVQIGSICGGGRYDDLTGIFGMPGVSGVGISFGADRIYDVMMQLNHFSSGANSATRVMFVNFGEAEVNYILPLLHELRRRGINAEIYPDRAKIKKQLDYANTNGIPYVAMAGENEIAGNMVTLKNMLEGRQKEIPADDLWREFD